MAHCLVFRCWCDSNEEGKKINWIDKLEYICFKREENQFLLPVMQCVALPTNDSQPNKSFLNLSDEMISFCLFCICEDAYECWHACACNCMHYCLQNQLKWLLQTSIFHCATEKKLHSLTIAHWILLISSSV